jgi:MFS family permease
MFIVSKAFVKPLITLVVLAIVGLSALALQVNFDWNPHYALSEILFLIFTGMTVYVGSAISSRILPRLHRLEEHIWGPAPDERNPVLPLRIGDHQWLSIGVLGILVGLAALYTHVISYVPWKGFILYIYFFSIFLNFMVVGAVVGLYGLALIWLVRLPNQEVNIKPFEWRPEVIAEAANIYLLITLFGVGLYLLGLLAIWVSPGGAFYFAGRGIVRTLWILPLAAGVAGYFCLTQFFTHRIIQNSKSSRLKYLRTLRNDAFSQWEERHRAEDAEMVNFLTRTIDDVSKEGTWPSNIPKLLSVLIPIFIPALKQIVKLFNFIFGGNGS